MVLTGIWLADPALSSLRFAIRHMQVATFTGELRRFEAALVAGADGVSLHGSGSVASITTRDAAVAGRLLERDFFDAARHPDVGLVAAQLVIDRGAVTGEARLTMKGATRPVLLRGAIAGPVADPFGARRLGLELETEIERTAWGIGWNAPLPGGGLVLGNEVVVTAHLELVERR